MKILVWGTGRLAGKVIGKYIKLEEVYAFVDNNKDIEQYMGKKVYSPIQVLDMDYDAIVVANLYSQEIYKQCMDVGIDSHKVIFLYNNYFLQDMNRDYSFIEKILGTEYAEIIKNRYHVIRGTDAYGDLCLMSERGKNGYIDNDYVRIKCFELAVKEIRKRNIKGDVAEVGVFRGEFAQYINYAFPDRNCYLFDTFEGFDENEALQEVKKGDCTEAFVNAYKNTNIEMVFEKMSNLDKVIIKQGFFPESLDGLETRFAFVSLDVDFEDSIYAGLEYFYPRLEKGGYIFVHDYNSDLFGVERAVDRYEKKQECFICKMPICDANGTLVITK